MATIVLNDAKNIPQRDEPSGAFTYIRFHGPEQLYASSYSDAAIAMWSEKMRRFSERGVVYCYFNNTMAGIALQNAKQLERKLE
jgi:uncharacterized protein YecE (DUF72 family)